MSERRVLVAYASRFGSTRQIAEAIGEVLATHGVTADVRDAAGIHDVTAYGAFVIGSTVEAGKWLPAAASLLVRFETELGRGPTWLFSSGPLGDRAVRAAQPDPKEVARARTRLRPRDAVVFAGAYDKATADFSGTGLAERLLVRNLMPSGDWRDWAAIRAWAETIARELSPAIPGAGPRRP